MGRGPESPIQMQIVRELEKLFDCWVAANNNGGYRTKTEAIELKDVGTKAGYPDLSVFGRAPQMFFIECKAKIQVGERALSPFKRFKSLSNSQKAVVPMLRERGFRVAATDDVEEAVACARAFGLAPKSSAPKRALPVTGF